MFFKHLVFDDLEVYMDVVGDIVDQTVGNISFLINRSSHSSLFIEIVANNGYTNKKVMVMLYKINVNKGNNMNDNLNNEQVYEGEIDLRELIMILWKRKTFIICSTLIIAILAGVYSKFIVSPVYNTQLDVAISMPEIYETRFGEYKLPFTSNGEYLKLIKSNDVIKNTIVDMDYDLTKDTVEKMMDRITLGEISTSANIVQNNFTVTVSADNPEESLRFAQNLYENYIEFVDVMMKERVIGYYNNDFSVKIASLENTLETSNQILVKNEELLTNIPQTINQKDAAKEIVGASGYIILENIINPNYTELENNIIENKQLIAETETTINQYKNFLTELDVEKVALDNYYASGKTGKNELNIMDVVKVSIYQPSQPVAPTSKTSPSTLMNVVIGGVLGGMLSVIIVFFKAYWKKEI